MGNSAHDTLSRKCAHSKYPTTVRSINIFYRSTMEMERAIRNIKTTYFV